MTSKHGYYMIGKLYIHRGTVICDCKLPIKAYMTLVSRLFPDSTLDYVQMENVMIDGGMLKQSSKIYAYFDRWEFEQFTPDLDELFLPWTTERFRDDFEHFAHHWIIEIHNRL